MPSKKACTLKKIRGRSTAGSISRSLQMNKYTHITSIYKHSININVETQHLKKPLPKTTSSAGPPSLAAAAVVHSHPEPGLRKVGRLGWKTFKF